MVSFRYVMDKVCDLQELMSLSEGELEKILGNSTNAGLLHLFLHSKLNSSHKKETKKKAKWILCNGIKFSQYLSNSYSSRQLASYKEKH